MTQFYPRYLTGAERVARNAIMRNENNAVRLEDQGFDEETAYFLACEFPEMRHQFHRESDAFFLAETSEHRQIPFVHDTLLKGLEMIDTILGTTFSRELIHYEEWVSEMDHYWFAGQPDAPPLEECREQWKEQVYKINSLVERAMRAFDQRYGTDIAPTGNSRLLA